jgi:hypothetical protein
MYHKEFYLPVFKRISISLNEEEEAFSIFPLLPDSTLEKLIFLSTAQKPTYTTPTGANYAQWSHEVQSQLPAFLYYLLNIFEIPMEIRDTKGERYGIQYRNEMIQARVARAPTTEEREMELDDIVRTIVFPLGQGNERLMTNGEFCSAAHDFKFLSKRLRPF